MPDDQSITLKNIIGMGIVLAVNYGIAALLAFFQASVAEVCLACVVLLLLSIVTINRYLTPRHAGTIKKLALLFCVPHNAVLCYDVVDPVLILCSFLNGTEQCTSQIY